MATSVGAPHVRFEGILGAQEATLSDSIRDGDAEEADDGEVDGDAEEADDGDAEEADDGDAEEEDDGDEDDGEVDGDAEEEDDEDGDADDGEVEEGQGERHSNAGWAEAMAKILQKKIPESKLTILVKNRELEKVKERGKKEQLERKKQLDKKRTWEMLGREKPDVVKDRETERNLQRIATRGVVQLFNAVRKHQKNVEEKVREVGGSESKRAKLLSSVSKKDFISVLRGANGGSDGASKTQRQEASPRLEENPGWNILRDDFMMGASMKDWDRESEDEGQLAPQQTPGHFSSDSD